MCVHLWYTTCISMCIFIKYKNKDLNKMGRKKMLDKDRTNKRVDMRLTANQLSMLSKISNGLGINKSEFVRLCILEWVDNNKEIVSSIS